jgi:hypothetical protein
MPQSIAAFSRELEAAIQRASERYGVPPSTLRAFAAIESGGNPRASNGRYHGVYQLSRSVFQKYGGRGNIFDLNENTDVAARKLRSESDAFSEQYGRAPTAPELYMIHQQGVGGAAMHMASPDVPAWQNMYRTGEGQQKGPGWARLAIWGNVPADQRARFPGGVNNITSRQFMDMWAQKMDKFGGVERESSVPGHDVLAPANLASIEQFVARQARTANWGKHLVRSRTKPDGIAMLQPAFTPARGLKKFFRSKVRGRRQAASG